MAVVSSDQPQASSGRAGIFNPYKPDYFSQLMPHRHPRVAKRVHRTPPKHVVGPPDRVCARGEVDAARLMFHSIDSASSFTLAGLPGAGLGNSERGIKMTCFRGRASDGMGLLIAR